MNHANLLCACTAMVTIKVLNPETTVISERYGLSFFGCVLTIGAIYLFVTFGPNSHEQLKAENIVKHVVAWPVLLYLVRTSSSSFRKCPVEHICCISKKNWYKAVMLFTLLVKRAHLWLLYKSVRSVCQVPDLSHCAHTSPPRGISWAFMSVLWPGITNSFFYEGGIIKIVVIFTTLQVVKWVKSQLEPEFLIS